MNSDHESWRNSCPVYTVFGECFINKEQIEGYVYHLISKYKISEQKQNSVINAIKCYYEHCLGMPREYYNITRPKKSVNLPNVLSEEEVIKILNQPSNIKR